MKYNLRRRRRHDPDTSLYFSSVATGAYVGSVGIDATLNSICRMYVTLSNKLKNGRRKKILKLEINRFSFCYSCSYS